MGRWIRFGGMLVFVSLLSSTSVAEEHDLQYFLRKATETQNVAALSHQERQELLSRMGTLIGKVREAHRQMVQMILSGTYEVQYQEGRLWMSSLAEDEGALETAIQQIKSLKEKPSLLVPPITLYKALRDLSVHFNRYTYVPQFSGLIGDLGLELELWVDPVFYQLCLLPLAQGRDKEPEAKPPPAKEKETESSPERRPPEKPKTRTSK